MDYRVLYDSGPAQERLLAATPTQEVTEALRDLCQAVTLHSEPDDEMLTNAGYAVGEAGHHGAEQAVLDWLAADRSAPRTSIAGAVLRGLWSGSPEAPRADAVAALEAACDASSVASPDRNAAALAFAAAFRRPDLDATVRDRLRARLADERDRLVAAGRFKALAKLLSEHLQA